MTPTSGPIVGETGLRPGETSVALPDRTDATLVFIGRIRTPWSTPHECPRAGTFDGPACRIEVDPLWLDALHGVASGWMQVLYWMHLARRDLTLQSPHGRGIPAGTFSLRSPVRPNPIASSLVRVADIRGPLLIVHGLDCVDGTPLVDLKPDTCPVIAAPSCR